MTLVIAWRTTKLIEGGHRGLQAYRPICYYLYIFTFFTFFQNPKNVTYVFLPCFIRFLEQCSPYCKISYLLAEECWRDTYNSWIDRKFGQSFLSNLHKRFFLFCPRFLRFLTFLNFYLNVYYIYGTESFLKKFTALLLYLENSYLHDLEMCPLEVWGQSLHLFNTGRIPFLSTTA